MLGFPQAAAPFTSIKFLFPSAAARFTSMIFFLIKREWEGKSRNFYYQNLISYLIFLTKRPCAGYADGNVAHRGRNSRSGGA
jgi:hypothetical protein